jgi:hypothetical protein
MDGDAMRGIALRAQFPLLLRCRRLAVRHPLREGAVQHHDQERVDNVSLFDNRFADEPLPAASPRQERTPPDPATVNYTKKQAAARLKCSVEFIRNMARKGLIPTSGRRRRWIHFSAIEAIECAATELMIDGRSRAAAVREAIRSGVALRQLGGGDE